MVSQRTNNPAFTEQTFRRYAGQSGAATAPMTVEGTVNKTLILLLLATISAGYTWSLVFGGHFALAVPLYMLGLFGGLVAGLITSFNPKAARFTAPIYALFEGLFLGAFSAGFNLRYQGIAVQAVGLTFGTLLTMLVAYRSGVIKVTDRVRSAVISATGGILLFLLAAMGLSWFGVTGPAMLLTASSHNPIAIVISLIILGVAAMNLLLDFDMIERATAARMPKFMEWYCGYGVMVTLIWLYTEFLRILAQLNGNRR